jgi:hypothetical protein
MTIINKEVFPGNTKMSAVAAEAASPAIAVTETNNCGKIINQTAQFLGSGTCLNESSCSCSHSSQPQTQPSQSLLETFWWLLYGLL